jgi:class 3 adenylate cyclase
LPVVNCSKCGAENPEGSRFCNACASPLGAAPAAPREERKIVTVLFADLVGFTARAERLDPEDVRAILSPYHARLREEIEAFGGTVEKFIGAAVVAFFGAPVAHGDDPERGVRAGLAVRSAVADMNAADAQLDLQVRVAVNTGEAIVSLSAKAELGEAMVAGDVVNTASRLQTAAPTNAVLVGEGTYRATRGLFDYEEVEPLVAKGKSAPLHAWLALDARTGPGERASNTAPMVGRVHETNALNRILDTVVAEGRPHLATIVGESGIGKTRLATEFTAQAESKGIRILRGRSLPYGTSTPYGPFAQQVKQFAGIYASDDEKASLEKLGTAVAAIVPDDAREIANHLELLIGLNAEGEVADRQILFYAARRFGESLARTGPTVFVFEDIHWADAGTLDLLEVLAARLRDVPVLLLALARPGLLLERPGWGGGLPAYTALSLEALAQEDARELAQMLLGNGSNGTDAARVAETAEGNPLFLEELAASVVEGQADVARELPTTIRELVSARLDALPAVERTVMLDAAVVGKTFWRGALERMAEGGADLWEVLDSLESRDLIRREPFSWIEGEEQFSFKHVMIREVAYATLPRATRKDRHAAVAEFLEAATAAAAATATALAQHWREAGRDDRALDYLLLAAEQAGRGWAKDEAARLYGEALELVPESDDARRREIARKRALALASLVHVADMQLTRRVDPELSDL